MTGGSEKYSNKSYLLTIYGSLIGLYLLTYAVMFVWSGMFYNIWNWPKWWEASIIFNYELLIGGALAIIFFGCINIFSRSKNKVEMSIYIFSILAVFIALSFLFEKWLRPWLHDKFEIDFLAPAILDEGVTLLSNQLVQTGLYTFYLAFIAAIFAIIISPVLFKASSK
jgi:hypothetical protein